MIRFILLIVLIFFQSILSISLVPLPYSILQENTDNIIDINNVEKRFYLNTVDQNSPFFMYLTPCGSSVHWQLFTTSEELSYAQEFSIISDLRPLEESNKFKLIAGEEDVKRMTFFSHHMPKKIILVISPTRFPSSVRIFFTPSLFRIEDQYPPLPHDTRVATTIETHKDDVEARVTFKIASQVRRADTGRYRICAIVSRREPQFAGQCDHVEEGVEMIKCVSQTNNSVLIPSLRRDKIYFITVFIRDYNRGTSSSYETQRIQTTPSRKVPRGIGILPRKPKKSSHPQALIVSKLQSIQLETRKGAFVNSRFLIPTSNTTQKVMLIIHACDGLVRINIFRNGRVLKRSDAFSGFRRFVVTNVRNGHLRFQIVNDDNKSKTVRIWASVDPTTSPYPLLPDDTSLKVVNRSCSTASIQWQRAHDPNIKYCVYKRKENSNFLEQLVSLVDNLCEGGLASSTFIGCYSHLSTDSTSHRSSPSLIETTISGLSPSSTYRFDLLAIPIDRPNPQALPYRTVWIRTNRLCSY